MSVGVHSRFSVAGDAVLWKTFPFRDETESLHYKYTKDMQPSGTVVFWYKPYPLSKKSGYFNAHH